MKSETKKTDWGLKFYLDVLKLDSLHFGLWHSDDPLTLEGMARAQKRYTEKLLSMIPEEAVSVLDAGCGTGGTTAELLRRGLDVEALNPDSYQSELVKQKTGGRIPLHGMKFEEFRPERSFDLILMSESSQYMDTGKMAENAASILKSGGFLLIADYFRKSDTGYYKSCKVKDVFLETLAAKGFILEESVDITEQTIPTLTLGKKVFGEYAAPVLEIITGYIGEQHPLAVGTGSFLLRKKLKKLHYYFYEKMPEKLDEYKFRGNMEYLFLLYRNEGKKEVQ